MGGVGKNEQVRPGHMRPLETPAAHSQMSKRIRVYPAIAERPELRAPGILVGHHGPFGFFVIPDINNSDDSNNS